MEVKSLLVIVMASMVLRFRELVACIFEYQHGEVPDMRPLNRVGRRHKHLPNVLALFIGWQAYDTCLYYPLMEFQAVFNPWLQVHGHDRLRRLLGEGHPVACYFVHAHAASCGDIPMLEEALKFPTPCPIMEIAAWYGHLNTVKYLHERRVTCTLSAMDLAAREGHLDVVKYLHEQVKASSYFAMNLAAGNGHLEIVEYLHNSNVGGCTTEGLEWSAMEGHVDVVEFLLRHYRQIVSTPRAMDVASEDGHLDVVKCLHRHGETCTKYAMDSACKNGHIDIVKFLHQNYNVGCSNTAIVTAASNGDMEMVQFLHEHKYEGDIKAAMTTARRKGYGHIANYLRAAIKTSRKRPRTEQDR